MTRAFKFFFRFNQFNQVTLFGFLGATVFNSLYMVTGFLIFGGACKGLILNNFVNSDALVTASRIGVYISQSQIGKTPEPCQESMITAPQ